MIGMSTIASAQTVDQQEVRAINDKYDLSLSKKPEVPFFDLSRLNLRNSYSISFYSGNGYSGTMAMYSGSLLYKLRQNMSISFNLDVLHQPNALFDSRGTSSDIKLIPSGTFDWRPSKHFRMQINFTHIPSMDYNLFDQYLYNRYGRYYFYR